MNYLLKIISYPLQSSLFVIFVLVLQGCSSVNLSTENAKDYIFQCGINGHRACKEIVEHYRKDKSPFFLPQFQTTSSVIFNGQGLDRTTNVLLTENRKLQIIQQQSNSTTKKNVDSTLLIKAYSQNPWDFKKAKITQSISVGFGENDNGLISGNLNLDDSINKAILVETNIATEISKDIYLAAVLSRKNTSNTINGNTSHKKTRTSKEAEKVFLAIQSSKSSLINIGYKNIDRINGNSRNITKGIITEYMMRTKGGFQMSAGSHYSSNSKNNIYLSMKKGFPTPLKLQKWYNSCEFITSFSTHNSDSVANTENQLWTTLQCDNSPLPYVFRDNQRTVRVEAAAQSAGFPATASETVP